MLGSCRHFAPLHVAFLRAHAVPARVRCRFGRDFDREKSVDHWITERWDGRRWVRDDPQIDDLAALVLADDVAAIRHRYETNQRLRVPDELTSFVDGKPVAVRLSR